MLPEEKKISIEPRLKRLLLSWAQVFFFLGMSLWVVTCAPDYRDKSSVNGRQAILDEADNHLTSGNCDEAIKILEPLVNSPFSSKEALFRYAAAYGCKGGVNMPNLVAGLQGGSSDIWSTLIKVNYSSSTNDGKRSALDQASSILRQTANPPMGWDAYQRTPDANVFMIFLQMNTIATTIAPLGNAAQGSGKKQLSISNSGTTADLCHVAVAIAVISDSLSSVNLGSGVKAISDAMSTVCQSAFGSSVCPQGKDYDQCLNNATMQAQGQLLINAIDNQWN